jgi:hypothetical protein
MGKYTRFMDQRLNAVKMPILSQVWWYILVITALRRLKQKDWEMDASMGYRSRHCVKTKQKDVSSLQTDP